jgi:monoamine oxidase
MAKGVEVGMDARDSAARISRRSFQKLALAGMGVPALAPSPAPGRPDNRTFDVLVVGGGVSGAYVAWRLMTGQAQRGSPLNQLRAARPKGQLSVGLLEASDRIGGRLYSITRPEAPDLHAELGGMRFLQTQESVAGLARHLGLEIVDFPMGGPANRHYLRGLNLTVGDYEGRPDVVPYDVRASERGLGPFGLVVDAILAAFPPLATMAADEAREYLKGVAFEGEPLWDVGFWNFLARRLSGEAFHLARSASGYFTVVSNWNAYDAIAFVLEDFASPRYQTLRDGYQSLPLTLARKFVARGGALHLETAATSLSREPGLIRVLARGTGGGRDIAFAARHVVLALPRRALELLDPDSFIFTEQFRADLTTVTPEPGGKLFLWYDPEWWTPLGLTSGPSISDEPLRQCYYFGTEPSRGAPGRAGLLLASYHDGPAVPFWGGFFPFSAHTQPLARFANRSGFLQALAPPRKLIDEVTRQLGALHQTEVPLPHTAVYQNWTVDPYGGGWHFWNPHNRSWEVMARMRQPVSGANVHVCGEAFSASQGWVEGAINTAERVLETQFGLRRPDWVGPGYSFGP